MAVVGTVGSGKSSLLAALLGELQPIWPIDTSSSELPQPSEASTKKKSTKISSPSAATAADTAPNNNNKKTPSVVQMPEIIVHGTVAYCSQVPWIEAGTVKENILFGLSYDEPRYRTVITACALEEDLAAMPAGDETEIGERGISISGGQKARLALARAAYSGASIQLLDDPLSAVDPAVGRTLFDKCIGPKGVMQGSTRVLVTHQRQYLPACDRVVVMRQGRVVLEGSYEELLKLNVPEIMPTQGKKSHRFVLFFWLFYNIHFFIFPLPISINHSILYVYLSEDKVIYKPLLIFKIIQNFIQIMCCRH